MSHAHKTLKNDESHALDVDKIVHAACNMHRNESMVENESMISNSKVVPNIVEKKITRRREGHSITPRARRRMTISNSPGESGSIRKYLRSRKECSSVGSLPLDGIKDEKASKVGENTYTFGHQGGHEKQLMDPSLARTPGKATSQN